MDKIEFAKIAAALNTVYKKDNFLADDAEKDIWYRMLQDLPYKAVNIAINKWIATEKWSPTIAEIRAMTADIINEPIPGVEEEWEKVRMIARDYSPYDPDRTLLQIEELGDIARQCIKLTDIASIAYGDNLSVERAHFIKAYERLSNIKKTDSRTPESVRKSIQVIQPKRVSKVVDDVPYIPVFREPVREDSEFHEELRERYLR